MALACAILLGSDWRGDVATLEHVAANRRLEISDSSRGKHSSTAVFTSIRFGGAESVMHMGGNGG
jgi:hypothetical protein